MDPAIARISERIIRQSIPGAVIANVASVHRGPRVLSAKVDVVDPDTGNRARFHFRRVRSSTKVTLRKVAS